jgi:transposase
MIPADAEVFVGTEAVDLRWSFDILAEIVRERLGEEPRTGAMFVFFGGRGRNRLKILFWDRTGYCILYKRLEKGTFRLPEVIEPGARSVTIDADELALMLEGLEIPERNSTGRRRRMH